MIHKNKQRLTKITQYLIRIRNLKKKQVKRLVTVPRRTEKRDLRREAKAERAAKLDNVRRSHPRCRRRHRARARRTRVARALTAGARRR